MDQELTNSLRTIIDGNVREPDQVRKILADAAKEVEAMDRIQTDASLLLYDARDAFLSGWGSVEIGKL